MRVVVNHFTAGNMYLEIWCQSSQTKKGFFPSDFTLRKSDAYIMSLYSQWREIITFLKHLSFTNTVIWIDFHWLAEKSEFLILKIEDLKSYF